MKIILLIFIFTITIVQGIELSIPENVIPENFIPLSPENNDYYVQKSVSILNKTMENKKQLTQNNQNQIDTNKKDDIYTSASSSNYSNLINTLSILSIIFYSVI